MRILFWVGFFALIITLLSYFNELQLYFTTLGIIILIISLLLILIGYSTKKEKKTYE